MSTELDRWLGFDRATKGADGIYRMLVDAQVEVVDTETRAAQDPDGPTVFVASMGTPDRMGDVIEQGTWRLANYRRNPVILADHGRPVVGKGTARIVGKDTGEPHLEISVQWDDHPTNPVAQLLAHQHRDGYRWAGSVGFRPGKAVSRKQLPEGHPYRVEGDISEWRAGYFFSHCELLEFSSVAVPAHPAAIQASFDEERDAAQEDLEDHLADRVREALSDLLRTDGAIRRSIAALVWGQPAPTHTEPASELDAWLTEEA